MVLSPAQAWSSEILRFHFERFIDISLVRGLSRQTVVASSTKYQHTLEGLMRLEETKSGIQLATEYYVYLPT
jgi:hypothetical protein